MKNLHKKLDSTERGEYIEKLIPPPSESAGCFVDSNGIGWNIQNPDGTNTKIYTEVPMHQIGIDLWFDSPPEMHKGKVIDDKSAESLCKLYVDYLRDFVNQLEADFYMHKATGLDGKQGKE